MTTPTQDPTMLVDATERRVVPTEVDGLPARVVTAIRTYRGADINDVWDALTNPERLPRWFLPITGELRVGGRYQLEGNAGGQVRTCDAPRLLEVTWEAMGATSWLAVELSAVGDGTRLELRHTQHSDHDFWRQYGPGAVGVGWDLSLVGLDLHLSGAAVLDPAEFEAWTMTEPGRTYVTGSADAWADADIAGGAEPEGALAAGRATGSFYRGESAGGESAGGETGSEAGGAPGGESH